MKSVFSYDSPIMQILSNIGDLIILNFIFLICCIPVFTIGAAQAGLYTAVRVLQDKEDDSSLTAAFFRGFKNGFGTVTLTWSVLLVALVILVLVGAYARGAGLPLWMCVLPVCICALFLAMVPAFHSRFGCTAMQLLRNSLLLIIAHPLRSLGVAVLIWLPAVICALDGFTFMIATPIWGTLYFSTAILFCSLFLRKPFNTLVEHFNQTHAPEPETQALEETAEDEQTPVV